MQFSKTFWVTLGVVLLAGGIFYSIMIYLNYREIEKNGTGEISSAMSQSTNNETTASNLTDIPFSEDNKLLISKLSVNVPINFNIDGNNMQEYMTALEKGVDHLKGTALPGTDGNTVIFGHSSYYINKPGNFKTVFAKLDSLAAGDNIQIIFNGETYNYIVSEQKIVEPNDISVVSQDTNNKILTLITCWPPKTTDKRMVVIAEQQ